MYYNGNKEGETALSKGRKKHNYSYFIALLKTLQESCKQKL